MPLAFYPRTSQRTLQTTDCHTIHRDKQGQIIVFSPPQADSYISLTCSSEAFHTELSPYELNAVDKSYNNPPTAEAFRVNPHRLCSSVTDKIHADLSGESVYFPGEPRACWRDIRYESSQGPSHASGIWIEIHARYPF